MSYRVQAVSLAEILSYRALFLQETNFQIRYDACHVRGWSDAYLLYVNDRKVGYASVKGKEALSDRDAIFECFVLPSFRKHSPELFRELVHVSGAQFIECQSNDLFLTSLQFEFGRNINATTILFREGHQTEHALSDVVFRKRAEGDDVFGKKVEDCGEYVLVRDGNIVADGGFLTHYNEPFADLYMETRKDCWNQGLGSFILQEIKKECYLAGRIPAARCSIKNPASKATLLKAGFAVAGYMLIGEIK